LIVDKKGSFLNALYESLDALLEPSMSDTGSFRLNQPLCLPRHKLELGDTGSFGHSPHQPLFLPRLELGNPFSICQKPLPPLSLPRHEFEVPSSINPSVDLPTQHSTSYRRVLPTGGIRTTRACYGWRFSTPSQHISSRPWKCA
jgi:hypothetical protein